MTRRRVTDTVSAQYRLSLLGCRVAPCGRDRPHGTRQTRNRDRPGKCRGTRIRHGLRDSPGESSRSDNSGRRVVRVLCSWPYWAGCGTRYARLGARGMDGAALSVRGTYRSNGDQSPEHWGWEVGLVPLDRAGWLRSVDGEHRGGLLFGELALRPRSSPR